LECFGGMGGKGSKAAPQVAKTKTVGANYDRSGDTESKEVESITGFTAGSLIFENPSRAITEDYNVDYGKTLGEGGYGTVVLAQHKCTGAYRAIKQVNKSRVRNLPALRAEIELMKLTDHPNIVKLYESFEDRKKIYLVMECCEGGELFDAIIEAGKLDEPKSAVVMRQLLRAVRYMHDMNMVHRDLKPENLILVKKKPVDQTPLKVIDFGLAEIVTPGRKLTDCKGSSYYMAPETLNRSYGVEVDVWACGIIMFILLTGTPPFFGDTDDQTYRAIKRNPLRFDQRLFGEVSEGAISLIRKMLQRNVSQRATAAAALNDKWITSFSKMPPVKLQHNDLSRLIQWQTSTPRLAKAALEVIVLRLSELDIKPMKDLFLNLDIVDGGSGYISGEEMVVACAELPDEDSQKLVTALGDKQMGYTEYLAAAMDRSQFVKQETVELAFSVFDRQKEGKLSSAVLKEIFGPEAEEILREARSSLGLEDKDGLDMKCFTKLLSA